MDYILITDNYLVKEGLKFRYNRRLTDIHSMVRFPVPQLVHPYNASICRIPETRIKQFLLENKPIFPEKT